MVVAAVVVGAVVGGAVHPLALAILAVAQFTSRKGVWVCELVWACRVDVSIACVCPVHVP